MKAYGWLIYNHGLKSPKYKMLHTLYEQAAYKLDIKLDFITNTQIYSLIENGQTVIKTNFPDPDFVLFLDKDIHLAQQLENQGYHLFNSSKVIETCDNKILTFQALANQQINMPKTIFSPLFFKTLGKIEDDFISFIEAELGYPLVIKEAFGSLGAQVYLIHNRQQLITQQKALLSIPHLYQEFIVSSIGQDVRIYVVGNQICGSIKRYSTTDFRANISNGSSVMAFEPNESFCQLALTASLALGADFTGVGLLFGKNGEPILCEVNSNSDITGLYDCSDINVAEHILRQILESI